MNPPSNPPEAGQLVSRLDRGVLGKVQRTPQGGIRVDAAVGRSGILVYLDAAGRPVREYRPPEENLDAVSLASLQSAPVTFLHPPGMVTPENFQTYSRGHVAEGSVRKDGDKVVASLVIQDGELISAVDRGDLKEVSAGYRCRVDNTPGVTPAGERFDRIQRGVVYNHVAIVPKGRAGAEVALRLDAAGNETQEPPTPTTEPEKKTMKPTIRIDGVDFPLSTEAEIQAAVQAHGRFMVKLDQAQAQAQAAQVDMKAKLDAAEGQLVAAKAEAKTAQDKLAEALDPRRMDAAVEARVQLVAKVRGVMGQDFKMDGLTDVDAMKAVVAKVLPDVKLDGRSPEFIQGVFQGVVGKMDVADPDGLADIRRGTQPDPAARQDAPDKGITTVQDAKDKMDTANAEAWKRPLAVSKDAPARN